MRLTLINFILFFLPSFIFALFALFRFYIFPFIFSSLSIHLLTLLLAVVCLHSPLQFMVVHRRWYVFSQLNYRFILQV